MRLIHRKFSQSQTSTQKCQLLFLFFSNLSRRKFQSCSFWSSTKCKWNKIVTWSATSYWLTSFQLLMDQNLQHIFNLIETLQNIADEVVPTESPSVILQRIQTISQRAVNRQRGSSRIYMTRQRTTASASRARSRTRQPRRPRTSLFLSPIPVVQSQVQPTYVPPPSNEGPNSVLLMCSICHSGLISNRPVSTTCGHFFCRHCLEASLESCRLCPICRKYLNPNDFHDIFP